MYNDYAAYDYCVALNSDNANYTDAQLIEFVQEMLADGDLIYVIFDYEYVSHSIYYMATGRTVEITRVVDLYAYTNSTVPFNIPETIYEVVPASPGGPTLRP